MDISKILSFVKENKEWYYFVRHHAPDLTIEQFMLFMHFVDDSDRCNNTFKKKYHDALRCYRQNATIAPKGGRRNSILSDPLIIIGDTEIKDLERLAE